MQEQRRATTPEADTVTFLFTDIEGSTALWEQDSARMSLALAAHDALVRSVVEGRRGTIVKMTGDGVLGAFANALDALAATLDLQQALADPRATCDVSLRVRCGLHAGVVERREDDYFGSPVNRAARIMSAAHGGQVLLSQAVVDCVQEFLPAAVSLRDLGNVRLKDIATPEHVYQVLHPKLRQNFPALRSLQTTPNNLPQQVTSFIGGEQTLTELKRLLAKARLLTLTGSGGCGKTRLSLQLAADFLDHFPDGVWLVEFAPVSDPDFIAQTVASVLGIEEQRGKPMIDTLTAHLVDKRLLLLLDNCEHLLEGCANVADPILRKCPEVTILASSREALGISGEQAYRVPSLTTPDPKQPHTPASVASFEAVQLFVDRALLARPGFQVTDHIASTLASICHQLDGIPLAIELAAARVRSLSVEEINRKLDQRFRLLTGGSRTALPRQQTLRSLIDWSYDLLPESERRLLQHLSVFVGGWNIEAVEQVCIGEGFADAKALDLLTSLADKSLVAAEQANGHSRYRLLESVRQYAREKLLESGIGEVVRGRHRDYFLNVAEAAQVQWTGAAQAAWLKRLEEEHENLRASLEWSLADSDPRRALRLCGALQQFWVTGGYLSEGRGWCARALEMTGARERTSERAKVLNAAGTLAFYQSAYPAALAQHEEALAIRRQLGDPGGVASSLGNLGNVAYARGDAVPARTLHEESLAIRRELGDRSGIASSLNNLGLVAWMQGDPARAETLFGESLAISRQQGNRIGIGDALNNLGIVAHDQGDYRTARTLYEQSLALRREVGHRYAVTITLNNLADVAREMNDFATAIDLFKEGLALQRELRDKRTLTYSLQGLAEVVGGQGSPLLAARIWGAAERLREEVGSWKVPKDQVRFEARVAATRAAFGDDAAFEHAWHEGGTLTLEQAIQLALDLTVERC